MTTTAQADAVSSSGAVRLRKNALGFPQLLAQSVALISPTMTAVLIIPLAFGNAGDGTWFAYLFATIMLLLVVFGLNQFARRSTTTGSMYAYTGRGLGPAAGVMSGWSLVWCYFGIGMAGLCGFSLMSDQLVSALGIHGTVTPYVLFAVSGAIGFVIAWKDVRLSAMLMLLLEGLSVACILALSAVILFKHGFTVDTAQVELKGANLKSMDFAVVVCIFSLVGFEAASTMGGEARNPLRNVPKAVVWSLLITGAFMVVMCYVEVFGAKHAHLDLASLGAPLQTLSAAYGVSFFKIPVSLGGMVSFFALTLSCVNSGTRILLPLGKHGFVSPKLHRTHTTNLTPHTAIGVYYGALLAVVFAWHALGASVLTMFGQAGTLAAFGFLCAYYMISVAAPFYLRKRGELEGKHIATAVAGCVCLLVPLVGSFYPLPPWPVDVFPAMFALFMLGGGLRLYQMHRRAPGTLGEIQRGLEAALYESIAPASDVESGGRVGLAMPAIEGAMGTA
jgi:amino acid transporter